MKYVEIARGTPVNRGIIIPIEKLSNYISKEPLYRSVYLYDDEGYDKESDDVVESAYGYSDDSAQILIEEAEYVLGTFYEEDHVRHESWKNGWDSESKECLKEIRAIRRWLKKWKPIAEGKS